MKYLTMVLIVEYGSLAQGSFTICNPRDPMKILLVNPPSFDKIGYSKGFRIMEVPLSLAYVAAGTPPGRARREDHRHECPFLHIRTQIRVFIRQVRRDRAHRHDPGDRQLLLDHPHREIVSARGENRAWGLARLLRCPRKR